ncbi:MAG: WecB/TagA/CpsF family glycosyltransferase, partial [Actinocatenispora sp.]
VYLLGGRPGVAARAARRLGEEHGLRVVGARDGYFDEADEPALIDDINRSSARILMVGLGNPRQELWLSRHRSALAPPVALTCGGWLDWTAGQRPPCPPWIYRLGMEWAYRLAQEPRRLFGRYVLGNPRFLLRVMRTRVTVVPEATLPR